MSATKIAEVVSVAGVCRVAGHAEALAELMAARKLARFEWGQHDCCLWAADAIRAQLGVDPAVNLRGAYSSELQAWRVVRGYGTLEGIARAALGNQLSHPMLACAGDVGLVEQPSDSATWPHALAVCIGEWWCVASRDGLSLRPLSEASMAWRVGCA